MSYIYIGKLINTHGIKGEVRVYSNFELKDKLFKVGTKIYVGDEKQEFEIASYRVHKKLDMFTFKGITNINEILMHKGKKVYLNKEDTYGEEVLRNDLINMEVYFKDQHLGKVEDILLTQAHDILEIKGDKKLLVPYVDEYVEKADVAQNKLFLKSVEVFLDED